MRGGRSSFHNLRSLPSDPVRPFHRRDACPSLTWLVGPTYAPSSTSLRMVSTWPFVAAQ